MFHTFPSKPDDFSMLSHYSGGNRKLERWLLDQFRKEIERDRAALDAALLADDAVGLTRALHRVKGAARTIGAESLARICDELERESRYGNVEAVRSRFAVFALEADRLVERIDRY